jgi:hypothetical protein
MDKPFSFHDFSLEKQDCIGARSLCPFSWKNIKGDLKTGRNDLMDVKVGDILTMKKKHPCGSERWQVLRIGMDFKLKCLGCGHQVMLPRSKAEKSIKSISRGEKPPVAKKRGMEK